MNVLTVTAYDAAGNTNSATLNVTYTPPDTTPPSIVSILPADGNPTNAATVSYTVTFTESVTGVDAADFTVSTGGDLAGAVVSNVQGDGPTRTVTVSMGTGNGTIWLSLNDSGTGIVDLAGNPLAGGYDAGNGYTIDRTPPVVVSCRVNPAVNPTNAPQVDYSVRKRQ